MKNVNKKQQIQHDIMEVLQWHAKNQPDEYVNPNFLSDILTSLEQYFNLENDDVDKYFQDMWGM